MVTVKVRLKMYVDFQAQVQTTKSNLKCEVERWLKRDLEGQSTHFMEKLRLGSYSTIPMYKCWRNC